MNRNFLDGNTFHEKLSEAVSKAVQPIAHREMDWSPQEMTKRIARYMRSQLSVEEVYAEKTYPEVSNKYVHYVMGSYQAACEDKAWFFELDLVDAFVYASWELYRALGLHVNWQDLNHTVRVAFEHELDQIMVRRALWDLCEVIFGRDTLPMQKVYTALWKTWPAAVASCKSDSRPYPDREKAEMFLKEWIESSMNRAWGPLQDTDALSEDNMMELWRRVVYPFGVRNEFSTVPQELLRRRLRGSFHSFTDNTVRSLVRSWESESSRPAKRRNKSSRAVPSSWQTKEEEANPEDEEEEEQLQLEEEEGPLPEDEELLLEEDEYGVEYGDQYLDEDEL
mmetsp:Transcript_49653/g.118243  ORF Transcript_49653/g.118243 Transcript_49653/m.118243 type:complete len:337 (-) Transcript_49653:61-1071(-)|eukprot:CAMPEP_0178383364 /NCGR_PEP_ID=MMETSP0689_2-20121128/6964_1 /TAXON_ID=160604 /ORGANISM="Amphidinium massartii, Strain CS-259" /LENGTH=336 /DNA_ID=CAMNT_0020003583 /DNA_START=75 /DNA_END=1085 /DNA_ORIENTATION=-